MRFLADGMLGRLARWLRLAGYDVTYVADLRTSANEQDSTLLDLAKVERRILLTCDQALHRRAKRAGVRSTLIESSDLIEQLAQVSKRLDEKIRIEPENSRCPVCNGLLGLASPEKVRKKVPATVVRSHERFWSCENCGKVYWKGKHWKTIIEMASRYSRMVP